MAGLKFDDGTTFNAEVVRHEAEHESPIQDSTTFADASDGDSDTSVQLTSNSFAPPLDVTTFADAIESDSDASVLLSGDVVAPAQDSMTFADATESDSDASVVLSGDVAAPAQDSMTFADATESDNDASVLLSGDVAAPAQDSMTFAEATESDNDASVLLSGEIAAPELDSATFAESPHGDSDASVLMSDESCEGDPAAKSGVASQDSGTIGDAADAASAPSSQAALDDDATGCLSSAASKGEDKSSIDPTHTLNFLPAANADDVTSDQSPGAARAAPRSKGGSPSGVGTLENVVVPGYEILEELGRGGMGVVYKARHRRLQRLVALKMVLAGAHIGKVGLARFRAEAAAIAQLQHPNIVQIYETGEHDGHPYFSLEFVDGGSLDQSMKEKPTTPRAAAQLVETLARTMGMAHAHGIVHRDLKPANILLARLNSQSSVLRREQLSTATLPADHWSRTSIPKIADFGLAKRVDDESGQTHTGTILGTPSYMAPEQAGGKTREIGPAADIYALGAILYELLTGRPPFKSGNPIDTIRQVIEQEPVPPRQLEARTPRDLETICLKCLEKEPSRRYASATDLADELQRFQDGEPILARPTPAWERAWKWGKRRPAIVALLAGCVLAVVGMVSFIVWHNVSLQSRLDDALAEERAAKQREQVARDEKVLSSKQLDGQKLYDSARIAVAAAKWADAQVDLTNALATIGGETRLDFIKGPAQALLEQVKAELRGVEDRRASQVRFDEFMKVFNEAQFLGTMYTGMELAANLKAARTTAQQALATYGVSAQGEGKLTLDAYLQDPQKAAIRADCYQLLLILAETAALAAGEQQAPAKEESLREALRLLERALAFGVPSRAYHVRRERYLNQLGDRAGAAQAAKAAQDAVVADAVDHFLLADEFYRRADYDAAIKEFEQVLQTDPNHFWAHYLTGLSLMHQKQYAQARAHLSAGMNQRSNFVWLYLLRGLTQKEPTAWAASEADFNKAQTLTLNEDSRYFLLVNRGAMRLHHNRCDDALADLQEAIKLKPRDTKAYVNMAQAYRQLKKPDLAVEQIKRALAIDPEDAHLYRLRARLHLECEEPALALQFFGEAIRRERTNSPHRVEDHVESGRLLLGDKRFADALASFDVALRLQQDHSLGQRLRAETLFNLARQAPTERDRRARYEQVVAAFDQYLLTGKPLESVYRGRGLAQSELGKYPEAIEDFTKALELQQTSKEQTSKVQAYRGWMHWAVDAPKLALYDFERAIELDPTNGDAFNGRGFVRASAGQHAAALKDAAEAVRLGPPTPRLLFNAARIHAQCPRAEIRAIELIAQALRLLPAEQRPAFWSAHIQNDRALERIRRFPGFLQIEKEMLARN